MKLIIVILWEAQQLKNRNERIKYFSQVVLESKIGEEIRENLATLLGGSAMQSLKECATLVEVPFLSAASPTEAWIGEFRIV